jgi:D-alanyl-D-alanine carboxypeptidase
MRARRAGISRSARCRPRQGAEELLERARDSVGGLLGSAQPFTQEVERNGTTLYRARFAGFAGKEAARDACAQLKSKSINCLAVPN